MPENLKSDCVKILYALQKTGNGHLARAQEIIPELKKLGEVDVLTSGIQSQILPDFEVKYDFHGLSLFYSRSGRLSLFRTIFKNRYLRFIRDLTRVPVKEYDLIINDFEPVSAWASILFGGNLVSLSHQASLWFSGIPRPERINFFSSFVIRYFAPARKYYGFHFKPYNARIFAPVIRQKIRALQPTQEDKYIVYLPAYSPENLYRLLNDLETQWVIFSREVEAPHTKGNCRFYPVNEKEFLSELASCKGVLCGAGFELPAEALFLGKKLFVIPIKMQLEQYYNAASLADLGVPFSEFLEPKKIRSWLDAEQTVYCDFSSDLGSLLKKVIRENVHVEVTDPYSPLAHSS